MRPEPGDIVLITQNAYDNDGIYYPLVAVEGSTAVILSFEAYAAYASRTGPYPPEHFTLVRQWMDEGFQYPLRILAVPAAPEGSDEWAEWRVGAVTLLDEQFFRILKRETEA